MTTKVQARFLLIESKQVMGQFNEPPRPEAPEKGPRAEYEPIIGLHLVADAKDSAAPTEDLQHVNWRGGPAGEIKLDNVRPQLFGLDKFPIHAKVLVTLEIIEPTAPTGKALN